MIADYQNLFSNDQAVTTDVISENVIDLGNDDSVLQALNQKGMIEVYCIVTTAFTSAGAMNVTVTLQSDDDVAFGSATALQSQTVAKATAIAGYKFRFSNLPVINEQYVALLYTVSAIATAGKIWAGLVLDPQTAGLN